MAIIPPRKIPSILYASPGTYTVLLSASNANGCSDVAQDDVTTQVAGDITPPATITDFIANFGNAPLSVELYWTAPGDDGTGGGAVARYDMRYSEESHNQY